MGKDIKYEVIDLDNKSKATESVETITKTPSSNLPMEEPVVENADSVEE